jgi:hypothetical protein
MKFYNLLWFLVFIFYFIFLFFLEAQDFLLSILAFGCGFVFSLILLELKK